MICIDEKERSGDAACKMLDAKVWILVFILDNYHTCSLYDRPMVNIAEHVCPR